MGDGRCGLGVELRLLVAGVAAEMTKLSDGPATFRNLDVLDETAG